VGIFLFENFNIDTLCCPKIYIYMKNNKLWLIMKRNIIISKLTIVFWKQQIVLIYLKMAWEICKTPTIILAYTFDASRFYRHIHENQATYLEILKNNHVLWFFFILSWLVSMLNNDCVQISINFPHKWNYSIHSLNLLGPWCIT
jgi:hypothetical protein